VAALVDVRRLCLALPEVTERVSHGEPCWFVRDKKMFAMYAEHHHDDILACWLAAAPGEQEALIELDPSRFFRPPYVGTRGWIGVRLDVAQAEPPLAELVTDAYRTVAPAGLSAQLER
jgi:hypothetical protein